jgi:GMP synthase-like glutamine amidotransferase
MNISVIEHVPFEGPGIIASYASAAGISLSRTCLWKGETLPKNASCDLLVVMGGPMSVNDTDRYTWLPAELNYIRDYILQPGARALGICLGAQLFAKALGSRVYRNPEREIGWYPLERDSLLEGPLCSVFPEHYTAFHWHGETFDIPGGAKPLSSSSACKNQGFVFNGHIIGLQFHLETEPSSINALLEHCSEDLFPQGSYVSSRKDIEESDPSLFKSSNAIMHRLLDMLLD